MAIDFPASPAVGQRYAFNGVNYVFTAQGVWSVTGTGTATSTSKVTVQKFTASGTYTPTPGTQFAIIEVVGGGGGGGGTTGGAGSFNGGGGGGSGGYSRSCLTAAQLGASQLVTIGAGGTGGPASSAVLGAAGTDTSFGSLVIAKGGSGGAPAANNVGLGGAGGVAGTGDIIAAGAPGTNGVFGASSSTIIPSGVGGSSFFGGGGNSVYANPGTPNGVNGFNYGAGGGGSYAGNTAGGGVGGAGSAGIVIVTEYNIAAAGPQGPAGPMGGTTGVSAPGGRLTLNATTPVMTASNVASPMIFYVPYIGDRIPIFDGANMVMTTFPGGGSLQCLLTDTSKNPGAIGISKVNDWYVWSDGGTIRLSHGPDWTSDTVRAPGTLAPVMINGIWTNAASITNGPAQNFGTYVGTTRSNASKTLDWIYGGSAIGGTPAFLGVWNAYNRVNVATTVNDSSLSWTVPVTTQRPLNNSTQNRVQAVFGLSEDITTATLSSAGDGPATSGVTVFIGLDSTTVQHASCVYSGVYGAVGAWFPVFCNLAIIPPVGFHFWQALDFATGASCSLAGAYGGVVGTVEGLTLTARM